MKIVVSSNCQTGGLSAALQLLLPHAKVIPFPLTHVERDWPSIEVCPEQLREVNAWVTSGGDASLALGRRWIEREQILLIPTLTFRAFHPDNIYVRLANTGALTRIHYNSALVAWAYNNRISPADVPSLFADSFLERLGFGDLWYPEEMALRRRFEASDIDFDPLFLHLKRHGAFMHSINHPKISSLSAVAQVVAAKLGWSGKLFEYELPLKDALAHSYWPLYPYVARRYAVASTGYHWAVEGQLLHGVESFARFQFKEYVEQGAEPGQLELLCDTVQLDCVLRSEIRK